MEVKFEIGHPVPQKNFINLYELKVEFMHGDADGATFRDFTYDDTPAEVEKLKLLIGLINSLEDNRLDDDQFDVAKEFFLSIDVEEELADEIAREYSGNFYEGDITCEGRAAPIVDFDLYYWDQFGVQRRVTVDVNHEA